MFWVVLIPLGKELQAQKACSIKGRLGADQNGMVFISVQNADNSYTKDSAAVKNGIFYWEKKIAEPCHASLVLNPDKKGMGLQMDQQELFLDPGVVAELSGNAGLTGSEVKGGPSQQEYMTLMGQLKLIGDEGKKLDSLYQKYTLEEDEDNLKQVMEQGSKLTKKRKDVQQEFIKTHPESFVAFILWLRKVAPAVIDVNKVEPEFMQFSARIRNSATGKALAGRMETARSLMPGKLAVDFSLPDTAGVKVALSSFRGKYVALCFWYRNFSPFESFSFALNRIYKQLAGDSLHIVSVFYNGPGPEWNAILRDANMNRWTNLIDRDGIINNRPVSTVAKAYDLSFGLIPQLHLIGPDGRIILRDINMAVDPVGDIRKAINK
ncbi:DUF4369 domain-containing protein [Filimonas zeae]|nr:DUF4369 domain-containing protein [Filimonas zeae]